MNADRRAGAEHLRGWHSVAFLRGRCARWPEPFNLRDDGILGTEFRAMMQLEWSQAQQRRFQWLLSVLQPTG